MADCSYNQCDFKSLEKWKVCNNLRMFLRKRNFEGGTFAVCQAIEAASAKVEEKKGIGLDWSIFSFECSPGEHIFATMPIRSFMKLYMSNGFENQHWKQVAFDRCHQCSFFGMFKIDPRTINMTSEFCNSAANNIFKFFCKTIKQLLTNASISQTVCRGVLSKIEGPPLQYQFTVHGIQLKGAEMMQILLDFLVRDFVIHCLDMKAYKLASLIQDDAFIFTPYSDLMNVILPRSHHYHGSESWSTLRIFEKDRLMELVTDNMGTDLAFVNQVDENSLTSQFLFERLFKQRDQSMSWGKTLAMKELSLRYYSAVESEFLSSAFESIPVTPVKKIGFEKPKGELFIADDVEDTKDEEGNGTLQNIDVPRNSSFATKKSDVFEFNDSEDDTEGISTDLLKGVQTNNVSVNVSAFEKESADSLLRTPQKMMKIGPKTSHSEPPKTFMPYSASKLGTPFSPLNLDLGFSFHSDNRRSMNTTKISPITSSEFVNSSLLMAGIPTPTYSDSENDIQFPPGMKTGQKENLSLLPEKIKKYLSENISTHIDHLVGFFQKSEENNIYFVDLLNHRVCPLNNPMHISQTANFVFHMNSRKAYAICFEDECKRLMKGKTWFQNWFEF